MTGGKQANTRRRLLVREGMVSKRKNGKIYYCEICGLDFGRSISEEQKGILIHMRRVHPEIYAMISEMMNMEEIKHVLQLDGD